MIQWTTVNQKLGKELAKARERCHVTQAEAAKACGIGAQFISNIERGQCAVPMYVLTTLAKRYGLSPESLTRLITDAFHNQLRKELKKRSSDLPEA